MGAFTAIGVPIDSVGRSGGTEFAPKTLRSLGLIEALGHVDAAVRLAGRVDADVTPNLTKVAPQANVLPKYAAPPPAAPKKDAKAEKKS